MKNLKLFLTYCANPIVWLTTLCTLTGTTLLLIRYDSFLPGSASYLLTANSHITIWHWQWKVLVAIGVAILWLLGLFWSFNGWKKRKAVVIIFSSCIALLLTGCTRQTWGYISSSCITASTDTTLYGVDTTGHDGDGTVDVYARCENSQLHPDSFKCGEIVSLDWDTNGIPFINPQKGEGFVCSDYTGHFCKQCNN